MCVEHKKKSFSLDYSVSENDKKSNFFTGKPFCLWGHWKKQFFFSSPCVNIEISRILKFALCVCGYDKNSTFFTCPVWEEIEIKNNKVALCLVTLKKQLFHIFPCVCGLWNLTSFLKLRLCRQKFKIQLFANSQCVKTLKDQAFFRLPCVGRHWWMKLFLARQVCKDIEKIKLSLPHFMSGDIGKSEASSRLSCVWMYAFNKTSVFVRFVCGDFEERDFFSFQFCKELQTLMLLSVFFFRWTGGRGRLAHQAFQRFLFLPTKKCWNLFYRPVEPNKHIFTVPSCKPWIGFSSSLQGNSLNSMLLWVESGKSWKLLNLKITKPENVFEASQA